MKKRSYGYVDSMVTPVPRKNLKAYRRMSQKMAEVWREHGALQFNECIANDVKKGAKTSFPQAVKLKTGEVVLFSWITYKSRAHRDRVMKKVMSDPRLANMDENMPFDGMRLFWGGFKPFISR